MKKILIILFVIIANVSLSQNIVKTTETTSKKNDMAIEIEETTYFQYRFSFDNIPSSNFSSTVLPQLVEIFKSNVQFYDILKQFIVESKQDVEIDDIRNLFQNTDIRINYFRKDIIRKNNELILNPNFEISEYAN